MGIGITYNRTTQSILTKLSSVVIGEGKAFAFPTAQFVGIAGQAIAESIAVADSSIGHNSSSSVVGECSISPVHSNQQSSQSSVIAECIASNVIPVQKRLSVFDEGVLVNPDVVSINFTGAPVIAGSGGTQDVNVAVTESGIDVYDEGLLVEAGARSLNFKGTLVEATTGITQDADVEVFTPTIPESSKLNPVDVSATYTAFNRDLVRADTSGGQFTVHLPASPEDGAIVAIHDVESEFGNTGNDLIVDTIDSSSIDGFANWNLDKSGIYIELRYNATKDNWRFAIIPHLCSSQ